MSTQPKDSSLRPLPTLKKVFARLRSPKPQSANDSSGAARFGSAPPIMRIPSSAIGAVDTGMFVTGEIPDNPSALNIDPHLIEHCRRQPFTWDCPAIATAPTHLDWSVLHKILPFKVTDGSDIDYLKSDSHTSTASPSYLPVADPGLKSTSKFSNKFLCISDASSPSRSFN